jgi:hypothetical protein
VRQRAASKERGKSASGSAQKHRTLSERVTTERVIQFSRSIINGMM